MCICINIDNERQPSYTKIVFNGISMIHSYYFPGGSVDKHMPTNVGDISSIPGWRKLPRAMEQLSPRATTTEPVL